MVSVVIIAKNAGRFLPKCITSVSDISDDIVVVVDKSTQDDTEKIAKDLEASIFIRAFDNFASQKNFGLDKAKYEWVLALDTDERLSPELSQEISQAIKNDTYDAYLIPRLNYFFGKPVWHTNWSPENDTHIWLFKKSKSKWQGEVHEEVAVKGQIGRLKNYKLHYPYQTVEQFLQKMNQYTSLEKKATNPIVEFLKRYLWHQGFRDGWHGFFLSYLMAIYQLEVQIKLWLKTK